MTFAFLFRFLSPYFDRMCHSINLFFSFRVFQLPGAGGRLESMDEPGSRNGSCQRKKPPWLKLDIPTIRLTAYDTPTLPQVKTSQNSGGRFRGVVKMSTEDYSEKLGV